MVTPRKQSTIQKLRKLASGLTLHAKNHTFTLHGETYSGAALVGVVQSRIEANEATRAAEAALRAARAAESALEASTHELIASLRLQLVLSFRNDLVALDAFGVKAPSGPRKLTTEERILKREKALATRKARGTRSKQANSKIKGNVASVIIEPVRRDE